MGHQAKDNYETIESIWISSFVSGWPHGQPGVQCNSQLQSLQKR